MQESIRNLEKYLGNIAIEMIKIGKEVKELKDQYESAINKSQEKSIDQIVCYRCGNKGHYSTKCKEEGRNTVKRKDNTCGNCGGKGHFTRECTSDKVEKDQIVCYRCNKMGHYAKDCRIEIKIIKKKDNKCKNCGKKGHYTNRCLNNQGKEDNNDETNIDNNENRDSENMRNKQL
ncbi:unnamed protein product [Rhizophagus irregularis]|uniref:CCHC-type domain-containing protein n=1 Tax=Rhizophagus irregularis TaxID=588596 RepID=A0A2I1H2W3_9GLOM|nr:hypothetical protein RhiirA4_471322 [Rhizophagus irregularis]CAB4424029.1 unnamed protein product [Rhizophagus irregularis]